jgi:hypothetical protein
VLPIRPSTPISASGWAFFGGVAEFFQIGQQLAALLVVFEVLDHLVQRLAQWLGGLRLGFVRTAEQARQADGLRRSHGQECQQANQQVTGQGEKTGKHWATNLEGGELAECTLGAVIIHFLSHK